MLFRSVKLLRGRLETFAEQASAAQTRAVAVGVAQQALTAASHLVDQWAAQAGAAATAYETARALLRQVRQHDTRASLAREGDELRQKAQTTQARLQQVETEQLKLLELQGQLAASQIDAALLQQLRDQSLKLRELQIRRAAAATRLRFKLLDRQGDGQGPGHSVQLGDETLTGSGERLLQIGRAHV